MSNVNEGQDYDSNDRYIAGRLELGILSEDQEVGIAIGATVVLEHLGNGSGEAK